MVPTDRPLALVCLVMTSSLTVMAGAMVGPALPLIADHFAGHPLAELYVPLVVTIPGLVIALTAPLAGTLADRWGRARLLLAGLALYALSGASGLVLGALEAIIVGRVFLGLAVACVMTCTMALIIDYWQDEARQRVLGFQGAAMGIGGVVFPLLAGALATVGWRAAFAGYLLVLPLLVLAAVSLKDVPRAGNPAGDGVARFPWGFALAVFFLASFGMIAMYAIPLRVVFLLKEIGYPSPLVLALGIALPSFFASVASFLAWMVQRRMSALAIVVLTFLSVTLGYGIVATTTNLYGIFLGLAFCGAGFGLNTPNLTGWLQQTVPPAMRGRAAGGFATAIFLGQFLATFVFAYLARVTDFAGTFTVVALASAAVALSALVAKVAFGLAPIGVVTKPHGRAVLENQAARRVE